MRIGVLGATGPAGSGLAVRLASVGYDVVIGSRSKYRAMEVADKLLGRWPDRELAIEAADNEGAASADVVVIATPWDAAGATAASVQDELAGKVVISMANALAKVGHEFQPLVPPRGSVAASVQAAVPRSKVAAAFHHLPAKELGDIARPIESDVLVCSDHPSATETVLEIINNLPDLRGLDSGELSNAAPIEAFAAVLLQVNVRYKTRVAVRFTGLDDAVTGPSARSSSAGAGGAGDDASGPAKAKGEQAKAAPSAGVGSASGDAAAAGAGAAAG